ncbi:MAG: hypothetical protein ACI4XR_05575 [Bacilli bacterium]
MNSLAYIKSVYKPFRITKNKNVTIIESTEGKFVLKKENKDLYTLFNYLEKRGFTSFPKLVKNFRDEDNLFEFVNEDVIFNEQKLMDLSDVLSSLHNKTVYFKETNIDNYKEIYENIENNIKYLSNYYNTIFLKNLNEEYQSPSNYLYSRNYFKIREALNFCKDELDNWYSLVNDKEKVRVSVVHNNLAMDHFIENRDNSVLVSWDNYKIDTPVLDFVNLYHNEYLNYDFSSFLENYLNTFELLDEEKKLLFILISLPKFDVIEGTEFEKTKKVHENVLYLYKTEKLIRPYYMDNDNN